MTINSRIRFIKNFMSPHEIAFVIFYVTSMCNAKCKTCFYWESLNKPEGELTIEEIKKLSKNFKALQQLSLTGGEPFMRHDLAEIIKIFVKNTKVPFITIPTNGILTKKIENTLIDILKNCPDTNFRISLSLDGIGEMHDEIREFPGNFEIFLKTFHMLSKLRDEFNNISIDICTPLSSFNQHSIKEVYEYVDKNLQVDNHVINYPRGNPKDIKTKDVDINKYKEILKFLNNKITHKEHRAFSPLFRSVFKMANNIILETVEKKKMVIPCVAGKKFIIIGEKGDVYPCEILPASDGFGNLKDVDFDLSKLTQSQKAIKVIKRIKDDKCFCTFECAVNTNIVYRPKLYPTIIKDSYIK